MGVVTAILVGLTVVAVFNRESENSANHDSRKLSSEVYVWQRKNSIALTDALQRLAKRPEIADKALFLAIEARWRNHGFRVQRFAIDGIPDPLRSGAVIRIGVPPRGGWTPDAVEAVRNEVSQLAERWPEVQIDYDCPQSRLSEYEDLLEMWRPDPTSVKFSMTALPCWLGEDAFADVLASVDDYVLQVHSLHLPSKGEQWVSLIEESEAL